MSNCHATIRERCTPPSGRWYSKIYGVLYYLEKLLSQVAALYLLCPSQSYNNMAITFGNHTDNHSCSRLNLSQLFNSNTQAREYRFCKPESIQIDEYLPTYLPTYLHTNLSTYLSIHTCTCTCMYICLYVCTLLSVNMYEVSSLISQHFSQAEIKVVYPIYTKRPKCSTLTWYLTKTQS